MPSFLCSHCGYNLDGLPSPARCVQCPECGETTYIQSGGLRQLPLGPWLVALAAGAVPMVFAITPLIIGGAGGAASILFFPLLTLLAVVIGPITAFIVAHKNAADLDLHRHRTHWSARPAICGLLTAADSFGLNIVLVSLAAVARSLMA